METIYIDTEYDITLPNGEVKRFLNGFEYIKYKRRALSFSGPILFSSFYCKPDILKGKRSNIINAIGHNFLQLPFTPTEYEKMKQETLELNEIQLRDIVLNFCLIRSALREGFHDLKGKLRSIKGKAISSHDKIAEIKKEITLFKNDLNWDYENYPKVLEEFDRISELFETDNLESVDLIIAENEESFSKYLPVDEDNTNVQPSTTKGWKILFLDDRPSELQVIFKQLSIKNIAYIVASSVKEAQEFILADIYNQIVVVVSDYRLFEPESLGRMQIEQGYDFLIWLSKQERYNAMIALSGLSKWFLLDSFRREKMNVKIYSKNGLLGGGVKLFLDDVEYLGDQYVEIIHSQPKGTQWIKGKTGKNSSSPLKPFYVFHRNHKDYLVFEDLINKKAERIAREVEYAIDQSSNFNFATIASVKGEVTRTLKGDYENEYENFRKKLLFRRVFYYLFLKGFRKASIIKLLHKGNIDAIVSESMIKQIPNMLAIQAETDIPYNLLIEEKYFLNNYMQIPIFSMAEMMDQTHSILNSTLTKYLVKSKMLQLSLGRHIIEVGSNLMIKTVSITEVHTLVGKMAEILQAENKESVITEMLHSVKSILMDLEDKLPNKALVKNGLNSITNLQVKYLK